MQLPLFQTSDRDLSLLSTKWKSILDPVIACPMAGVTILSGITLAVGTNVINHKLGRVQQGWFITDINGVSSIYRNAAFNEVTLSLSSSGIVTVSIGVF